MDKIENILNDISESEEFDIWFMNGVNRGWITMPYCNTHDGDQYMTDEEMQEWEDGGDPCCSVTKVLFLQ
jgi:hypothetical protein